MHAAPSAPVQTADFLPPQFSAADPRESVFILVFAVKSHQIMFLGRVGGAVQNEIPTESRSRRHPPTPDAELM